MMTTDPLELFKFAIGAVVIGSALWALADARSLGLDVRTDSKLWNLGPAGWFVGCLMLWFPPFFVDLIMRPRFKRMRAARGPASSRPRAEPQPETLHEAQPRRPRWTWPGAETAGAVPEKVAAGLRLDGVQAVVWGALLIAGGLGLAALGGWQSYADASAWMQQHDELQALRALNPQTLAELREEVLNDGDLVSRFAAAFLMQPATLKIAINAAENNLEAARERLFEHLPAFLAGLALVGAGNRLLGRVRKSS